MATRRYAQYPSRRVSSSRRRGYTAKRGFLWIRNSFESVLENSPNTYPIDLLPDPNIDRGTLPGSTVMRIRADFYLSTVTPTTSLTGDEFFYVGVCVYDRGAFGDLNVKIDQNTIKWMYWRRVHMSIFDFGSQVIGSPPTSVTHHLPIDVKSARRITQPNDTCVLILNGEGWVATDYAIRGATSVLLKV